MYFVVLLFTKFNNLKFNFMKKLLIVFLILSTKFSNAQTNALYADLGSGSLRNNICWFDWSGFTVSNGASRSFITADGLNVNVTFSSVTNPPSPSVMQTWSGSVLWNLYNYSNTAYNPALYNNGNPNNSQFTIIVNATRNGNPVPFTFVAADAEASITESTILQTTGTPWKIIDFFRNSTQNSNPVLNCNTQTSTIIDTYGGSANTGQNPVISTEANSSGSLTINAVLNKGGISGGMAVAFGIFSPIDRGDLPSTYGYAQHQIKFNYNNSCNFNSPLPTITQIKNLYIGNNEPDADGVQSLDDNSSGFDEDAFPSSFPNYLSNGTYSLTFPVLNTTGNNAYISGWFDYNRNGIFDATEIATAIVATSSTSATLTWTGLPTTLPQVNPSINDFGFRFRISSNQTEAYASSGFAIDGEVEDYYVPIITSCPQDCYWTLNGNTINANQFIGTSNNQNFTIKTNSLSRMVITGNNGYVGIGLASGLLPNAKLHVDNAYIPNVRFQNLPNTRSPEYVYIDSDGFLYRSRRTFLGLEYDDVDAEIGNAINALTERLNYLERVLSNCECGKGYFESKMIEQKKVSSSAITNIAPNPTNGASKVSYSVNEENLYNVELRLINAAGIVLKSYKPTAIKGNNTWIIADTSLSSANYMIVLIVNDKIVDTKVLVKTK